jgi:transcriptional regulator with XRE-family HTH domain
MGDVIGSTAVLGTWVRAARLAQGFTRDELANATGLSAKFISQVEAGKPTAQIGKVLQLLTELGVTLHAKTSIEIPPETLKAASQRRRQHRNDDSNT